MRRNANDEAAYRPRSVCLPCELRRYDLANNDPVLALRSSPCRCRGVLQCCSNVYRKRKNHRHPHLHMEGSKRPQGEAEQVCTVRHVRSEVRRSHVDNRYHAGMADKRACVGRTVQHHEERDRRHDGLSKDDESGPGSDPSSARKRIREVKVLVAESLQLFEKSLIPDQHTSREQD